MKEDTKMTNRLRLTVTYKNGNQIQDLVNYLVFEDGNIVYTVDKQAHSVFQEPVRIPVENIERYALEVVACDGWKVFE